MSSYGQVFATQIAATVPIGTSMQSAATGNGNGNSLTTSGYATSVLSVSGTFSANINFEATTDGSNWVPIRAVQIDGNTGVTTTSAAGTYALNCAGLDALRARISDYASGSVTVLGYVSALAGTSPGGSGGGGGDVNIDEIGGTAVDTDNGTSGGGTLRVTLASNSAGQVKLATGTNNVGSITDITGSVSLPTGAATSAKQPSIGTAGTAASDVITVQGIASMTPLKVDASVATVPISASSLPLPSGAATSAKQPALGTAGSPSTDVLSVQGVASGTAIPVSFSGNQAVNITQINGTTVSQGNGSSGNGVQRVAIVSDNTAFATICSGAARGSTPAASATVSAIDSNHDALDVYIRGGGASGGGAIAPGTTATYIGSDAQFSPGSTATDIWSIYGSSTKTIKIYQISFYYSATSSGQGAFSLLRRSTANSGGTSTSTTAVSLDSTNSSATASIKAYTANPSSLGTLVGQLATSVFLPFMVSNFHIYTHDVGPDVPLFDYRLLGQPIVLRGTGEGIVLNCGGVTPTAGTVKISVRVVFTEE